MGNLFASVRGLIRAPSGRDEPSALTVAKFVLVLRVVLGVALCGLCSCASRSEGLSATGRYYTVTVGFKSGATGETLQSIETSVRLGFPFSIETRDRAGNRYTVSGKLANIS